MFQVLTYSHWYGKNKAHLFLAWSEVHRERKEQTHCRHCHKQSGRKDGNETSSTETRHDKSLTDKLVKSKANYKTQLSLDFVYTSIVNCSQIVINKYRCRDDTAVFESFTDAQKWSWRCTKLSSKHSCTSRREKGEYLKKNQVKSGNWRWNYRQLL